MSGSDADRQKVIDLAIEWEARVNRREGRALLYIEDDLADAVQRLATDIVEPGTPEGPITDANGDELEHGDETLDFPGQSPPDPDIALFMGHHPACDYTIEGDWSVCRCAAQPTPAPHWPTPPVGTSDELPHVGGAGYAAYPLDQRHPVRASWREISHDAGCCASRGCHKVCSHLCGTDLHACDGTPHPAGGLDDSAPGEAEG